MTTTTAPPAMTPRIAAQPIQPTLTGVRKATSADAASVGAAVAAAFQGVLFAEDQDAVGEFGSGGQDEAFGEAVRSRTSRRDLDGVDPGTGQDAVEGGGELAGAVADEEPEGGGAAVGVHQEVAGLLVGPGSGSGRVAGRPEDVGVATADFQGEEHIDPIEGDRAVDVEEVHGQHGRGLCAQEPSP
jgi:hypothetical protein